MNSPFEGCKSVGAETVCSVGVDVGITWVLVGVGFTGMAVAVGTT